MLLDLVVDGSQLLRDLFLLGFQKLQWAGMEKPTRFKMANERC